MADTTPTTTTTPDHGMLGEYLKYNGIKYDRPEGESTHYQLHSPMLVATFGLLYFVVVVLMVLNDLHASSIVMCAVAGLVFIGLVCLTRPRPYYHLGTIQLGLMAVLTLISIWDTWPDWGHASIVPPILFGVILIGVFIAPWIAEAIISQFRAECREAKLNEKLKQTQLLHPGSAEPGWRLRALSLFSTLVSDSGLIAVFSAISVLVSRAFLPGKSDDLEWVMAGLTAGLLWPAFWLFKLRDNRRELLGYLKKAFFDGGSMFVSVFLIFVAAAQMARFGYVETFVLGVPWLVIAWFFVLYPAVWVYEYWICRALNEKLLSAFAPADAEGSADPRNETRLAYDCRPWKGKIFVHGNAGFALVATAAQESEAATAQERLRFFGRDAFVEEVVSPWTGTAAHGPDGGRQPTIDERHTAGRLSWLTTVYFGIIDLLMLTIVTCFISLGFWVWTRVPVIDISEPARGLFETAGATDMGGANPNEVSSSGMNSGTTATSPALPDLRSRLFPTSDSEAANKQPGKRILLAASGGGTRAALYTSSLLQGLRQIDALDDVVLVSGVSGGGVALAYYAAHAPTLKTHAPTPQKSSPDCAPLKGSDDPWKRFHDALAHDYIVNVMEGITECRIYGGSPWGQLLSEEFSATYADPDANMGSVKDDVLIILNSTLLGVYPPYSKAIRQRGFFDRDTVRLNTDTYHAGARLVFANFAAEDAFPNAAKQRELFPDAPQEHLKYVVIQDPNVRLADAAALNANFPPVFQNAAVRYGNNTYWATDGGANDNRGAISLLYLLRHAIELQRDQPQDKTWEYPEIHVVVAEASRVDIDFSLDRGARALTVSKTQVAHQLIFELFHDVSDSYKQLQGTRTEKARVHLHYLIIPSVLRMGGGMGTHWMPDRRVRVKDLAATEDSDPIVLDECEMRTLLIELHQRPAQPRSELKGVWDFIDRHRVGEDYPNKGHAAAWKRLVECLNGDCPPTGNEDQSVRVAPEH